MNQVIDDDNHEEINSSSDDDDDDEEEDDPRVAAMFQSAAAAQDESLPAATRPIHVSANAIMECFQRSLETHNHPNPASVYGIWKPPSLFEQQPQQENNDDVVDDWQPACLPLPAWVVQPPASNDALSETIKTSSA